MKHYLNFNIDNYFSTIDTCSVLTNISVYLVQPKEKVELFFWSDEIFELPLVGVSDDFIFIWNPWVLPKHFQMGFTSGPGTDMAVGIILLYKLAMCFLIPVAIGVFFTLMMISILFHYNAHNTPWQNKLYSFYLIIGKGIRYLEQLLWIYITQFRKNKYVFISFCNIFQIGWRLAPRKDLHRFLIYFYRKQVNKEALVALWDASIHILHFYIFYYRFLFWFIIYWVKIDQFQKNNKPYYRTSHPDENANLLSWWSGNYDYHPATAKGGPTNEYHNDRFFTELAGLEIGWTILPAIILIIIGIPSFNLLYSTLEECSPEITYKVIGHQWYWSYETQDIPKTLTDLLKSDPTAIAGKVKNKNIITKIIYNYFHFDSYLKRPQKQENEVGMRTTMYPRLLNVDRRLVIPIKTDIRYIITSADVLHSWAIPSLGVKMDACPGRLNEVMFQINKKGTFFGQCSELCGIGHGFMPIVIEAMPKDDYSSVMTSTILGKIIIKLKDEI